MLISLHNLEKSYPQGASRYFVLRQITLDIHAGEFV
jgi:ABC-type lipoprotein export system ATPase subunit